MCNHPELTQAEQNAINTLKRLAKRWPKSLWLFVDGHMNVMRCGKDGKRVMHPIVSNGGGGGVDQNYLIESVSMPCDGGDW